ncbi:MAG: cupin domain-containing protein [Cyanobacteria bacterium J06634_6]
MKRNLKNAFSVACFSLALSIITLLNAGLSIAEHASSESQATQLNSIEWRINPNIAGVQSAIVVGDPSSPQLYAMLGKMDAGTVFPAHVHPDSRITTVVSGVMYYGIGEQFDPSNIAAYPAGSIIYTAAGTPHFMWSKDGETIAQETGFGPSGIAFTAGG